MERYKPLDFDEFEKARTPLIVGATLGALSLAVGALFAQRERRKVAKRNEQARAAGEAVETLPPKGPLKVIGLGIVLLFGSALLGAVIALCLAFTGNAVLDDSPAKRVPVQIVAMEQTTHNGILRHYTIKFRRIGDQHDSTLLSTPQHMEEFLVPLGIALVHEGRFGWPWVEDIEPLGKPN